MKKVFFILLAFIMLGCQEKEREVYEVIDKGAHTDPSLFFGHVDYYITFRNVKTGKTYGYKCHSGNEYYGYIKGKKYYCHFY